MEKRVPTRTVGRGFENASGLGFWTSHPLHHAHMVNHQRHVRTETYEDRSRRSRAKNSTRKAGNHEPTASQMVIVGTCFSIGLQMQPGKSNRTTGQTTAAGKIEPDNWPDNWPVVLLDFPYCICSPMELSGQLSGSIFPAAFVVRWKNAFPQEPLVVGSRTRRV